MTPRLYLEGKSDSNIVSRSTFLVYLSKPIRIEAQPPCLWNSMAILDEARRRGLLIIAMIRNFFRRRTYVIGSVLICVCIFRFLNFTFVSSNINKLQLPLDVDKLVSSTIAGSLVNNFTRQLSPKSIKKHDKYVSYPWRGDPVCKHFTVQLAEKDSLPKWALTSFPGSGVTWTRQMIEGITGIYTGSVHEQDPSPVQVEGRGIDQLGITDDPFCGCTIIDKDHEATITVEGIEDYFRLLYLKGYSEIFGKDYGYRGVLLLRNPMDVVFTYRHWQLAGKVGKAPIEAFQGPQWHKVVKFVAYAWADHAIRWIEQIKKGTVVFYEELLGQNASFELERLLDAMDFKPRPVNPSRMRCTLNHRDRTDHKRQNKSWMPLEEEQRILFLQSIHRVQQSLRRRKWPQLPVHLYDLHDLQNKTHS